MSCGKPLLNSDKLCSEAFRCAPPLFYARPKITVTLPMVSDLCGGKVTVFFLLTHMDRVRNPLRRKGLKHFGLGITFDSFHQNSTCFEWRRIRLELGAEAEMSYVVRLDLCKTYNQYVLKNSRPVLMIRMGPLFKAMRLRQPAEDCLCVRSEVLKRVLSYHLADRSSRTSSDNGGAWI